MTIVVGTTTAPYKTSGDRLNSMAWIDNAEAVIASIDEPVIYFAALEIDSRGIAPFIPLINRLTEVGGTYWTFSLNDKVKVVDTSTRLRRICMGHNLVGTYALEEANASHVLFLASDTQARDDVLPRLLELDVAAAACHIPTYCFDGPRVSRNKYMKDAHPKWPAEWDIRAHLESCACMLLRRDVIRQLKWRTDGDAGMTDDPSMYHDLKNFLGEELYVRHDCLATHFPESVPRIEDRHTDAVRTIVR